MPDEPGVQYRIDLSGIDWPALKAALAADDFDNGRTPDQLRKSFENSQAVCIAWEDGHIVGTARALSDGVCNAYLVDVWTASHFRSRGIASQMIESLLRRLPGQHVFLQSDPDTADFYRGLGFTDQPLGLSQVVGKWLQKD
jgi:ribosomal protein S18 acetylase RimI-like enzyme